MPAKTLPPPPRPDPVTLDQIFRSLTTAGVPLNEKAYHLVALNTIAFHPSVKLFLFEEPVPFSLTPAAAEKDKHDGDDAAAKKLAAATEARNQLRRESLLKNVAFFLAQRNNAVSEECRWETVSLLGELCRMERTGASAASAAAAAATPAEEKLNGYAKANLEYLAQLPWFRLAVQALIDAGDKSSAKKAEKDTVAAAAAAAASSSSSSNGNNNKASSSTAAPAEEKLSREELRRRLRQKQQELRGDGADSGRGGEGEEEEEADQDVIIALRDIMNALPEVVVSPDSKQKECVWSSAALAQAHDLMFLDASTSMLHLIPIVSRCGSDLCAMCLKQQQPGAKPFLRCSSCKAVYYCSAECQKAHWSTAHRQPCLAYKKRTETILEEYYTVNGARGGGRKSSNKQKKTVNNNSHGKGGGEEEEEADAAAAVPVMGEDERGVVLLEVPLEPSLFFESRRYLYDHRDSSFSHVDFYDYYMKYTVRGN